jgi:hypothetical protein
MGKRSDFERRERDFYPTPYEAVVPLLDHLMPRTLFVEPCAGDGVLVSHLHRHGHHCVSASDIEPQDPSVKALDVFNAQIGQGQCFITNPPWDRSILHPIIEHLSSQAPTWLLFDADWMHTKQAVPYLDRLEAIVSVGRVKWIAGSKMTGKDNCCWYLFADVPNSHTQFYGRRA